jgi:hypothetical protein
MFTKKLRNVSSALSVIATSLALWTPCAVAQEEEFARKLPSFHAHGDFFDFGGAVPAQGDLNGDGILDIAVPGLARNSISVLLGKADGTFQAPFSVDAGAGSFSVVIADLNGDGLPDIAASTSSGVSVILSEGGGNFGAPTIFPAGKSPERIIVADFNGDHIPDLATANFDSNDVSLFLGKGDGTFREAATIAVGVAPLGLAAADFNADGHLDLVVSDSGGKKGPNPNTIAVLLGVGDGTFRSPAFVPLKHPEGIAVGDFNKDGRVDLAVALTSTDQVGVLLGNGDGTFQAPRLFTVFPQSLPEPGVGFGPTNVALADFDGDGNVDLAVANSLTSTVGVLFGDGTGNFKSPSNIEVGRTPVWVLTGDYNHDGKPDFLSSNSDASTVSVVLGKGDGSFLNAPTFSLGAQPRQMVVGDFNGDGVPDVASVGGFGNGPGDTMSVLLGKSGGGFTPKSVVALNANVNGLVAADLNRDGHMDLVGADFGRLGTDPGGITVLLGKGDGTFQAPVTVPAGLNPAYIAVADFNGDRKLDAVIPNFVFQTSVTTLTFVPGDGKGGFGSPSNIITLQPFTQVTALFAGDFNGDGEADIAYVATTFNSTLSVQFGNGDGTFQAPQVITSVGVNTAIFAVSVGDFNNDGNPDFAVEEGGVIEVLVGNGKGKFVSKGKFPENQLSSFSFVPALVLADFNGDGLLDVAATDGFDDNVPVLLGHGDGTLSAPRLIIGGGHTAAAVTADFNGDGRPDIALATTAPTARPNSAGEVILILNTTPK